MRGPDRAYRGGMSDSQHHDGPDSDDAQGTVSEGGSGSLGAETSQGGADSVPDTPDVNTTTDTDAVDINEPSQEGDAERRHADESDVAPD